MSDGREVEESVARITFRCIDMLEEVAGGEHLGDVHGDSCPGCVFRNCLEYAVVRWGDLAKVGPGESVSSHGGDRV